MLAHLCFRQVAVGTDSDKRRVHRGLDLTVKPRYNVLLIDKRPSVKKIVILRSSYHICCIKFYGSVKDYKYEIGVSTWKSSGLAML